MIRATWKDTVSSTDLSLVRCFISLWSKKCLGYVLLTLGGYLRTLITVNRKSKNINRDFLLNVIILSAAGSSLETFFRSIFANYCMFDIMELSIVR